MLNQTQPIFTKLYFKWTELLTDNMDNSCVHFLLKRDYFTSFPNKKHNKKDQKPLAIYAELHKLDERRLSAVNP
jgi:hypothetical protein